MIKRHDSKISASIATLSAASCLSACATIPGAQYRYAPAVGAVDVSVVQSLACSQDEQKLVILNAQPTITPSYHADFAQKPWTVDVKNDGNDTVDTDFTMTWWDDGRLKTINSVSTGEGEAILKDLISIAGLAVTVGTGKHGTKAPLEICKTLKNLNKDGVVSITYTGQYFLSSLSGTPTEVPAANGSKDLYDVLKTLHNIGPMHLALGLSPRETQPIFPAVSYGDKRYIWLKLQKVRLGTLTVSDQQANPLESVQILVPSGDQREAWSLPIPRPTTFGKSTFGLQVAESGAVTSVQYAKTAGTPAALNVVTAGATAFAPKSDADKLAALKAQDDLIVENNRHAKCIAQPDHCT